MFRVYKPKNFIKVRAVQVTHENLPDIASTLLGRVAEWSNTELDDGDQVRVMMGVEIPTFDGPKKFEIGSWIVRADDNTLTKISAKEFDQRYEVARNMGGANS